MGWGFAGQAGISLNYWDNGGSVAWFLGEGKIHNGRKSEFAVYVQILYQNFTFTRDENIVVIDVTHSKYSPQD